MSVVVERGQGAEITRQLADTRCWVFDFDGTLVDSEAIKWAGFEAAFADAPERREEILAYCRGQHGVIRTEKFRHVYETMLGQPYTAQIEASLQRRFESTTTARIIEAPEIPGSDEFLRRASRSRPLALLSTTPHEILAQIVNGRGWAELFGQVRGAPVRKAEWLVEFSKAAGQAPDQVLMFGDTVEDAEAAAQAGCRFVGVGRALVGSGLPVIADFRSLASMEWT
jgi:phosphoglycolate phosphatase-like HAD superfamily hydrolase